jgi:hypothetical protein
MDGILSLAGGLANERKELIQRLVEREYLFANTLLVGGVSLFLVSVYNGDVNSTSIPSSRNAQCRETDS